MGKKRGSKGQVDEALRATAEGPEALDRWLNQNSQWLSVESVAGVEKMADRALRDGDLETGSLTTMLALQIYMRLHNRHGEARCTVQLAQILFMKADTAAEYQHVHDLATGAAVLLAGQAGRPPGRDGFHAVVIAADAAYHASEVAEPASRIDWLERALEGAISAATRYDIGFEAAYQERYVSLAAALVQRMSDEMVDRVTRKLLQQLAKAIELAVPVDFAFNGDPNKTAQAAKLLAHLSIEYGSRSAGEARIRKRSPIVKSEEWKDA